MTPLSKRPLSDDVASFFKNSAFCHVTLRALRVDGSSIRETIARQRRVRFPRYIYIAAFYKKGEAGSDGYLSLSIRVDLVQALVRGSFGHEGHSESDKFMSSVHSFQPCTSLRKRVIRNLTNPLITRFVDGSSLIPPCLWHSSRANLSQGS